MTPWPAEQLDCLRQLVADGLSAGQIAAQMGISRGAVVGKIHRAKGELGTLRRKPGFERPKSEAVAKPARPVREKVAPPPLSPKLVFVAPPVPVLPPRAREIIVVPMPFSRAIGEVRCLFYTCDDYAPASADMLVCGCQRTRGSKPYCAAHLAAERERAAA